MEQSPSLQQVFERRCRAAARKGARPSRACVALAWKPHRRRATPSRGARSPRPPSGAPRVRLLKIRPSAANFPNHPARARGGALFVWRNSERVSRADGADWPSAFEKIFNFPLRKALPRQPSFPVQRRDRRAAVRISALHTPSLRGPAFYPITGIEKQSAMEEFHSMPRVDSPVRKSKPHQIQP